jgi:hypothetical protein
MVDDMAKNTSKPATQPRHPYTGRYIPRQGSTAVIREARQLEQARRQIDARNKKPTRASNAGVIIPD